nr:MAG TPA: tail protein [Bacteriophage sp.]
MADWLASMQQTFEYYVVDPATWKDTTQINTVKSCTIKRDSEAETLGSATIETTESLGECYIRIYLVTIQNGFKERHCLGTFFIQTPAGSFNGRSQQVSADAYTPLLELKETPPPLGYSIFKGNNVMDIAYQITRERVRAPVVKTTNSEVLSTDFSANTNDTWLTFLTDLIANAKYEFALDELGRILFTPKQDTASLQPIWTYTDDTSSILYPEMSVDHDLYGIPNVVEVVYSRGTGYDFARVVNDDSNSLTSTIKRGREIVHRVTDPDLVGDPTQSQLNDYANQLLRELSSLEYTITYTHGYCPVRLGDCVQLNYSRSNLKDVKARVVSQTIKCVPGCPVTEKAVFTEKLWR